jgi:hypothetical protein
MNLSFFLCLPMCHRSNLATGEGGGAGAKSYDGEKALSSISNSILSALYCRLKRQEKIVLSEHQVRTAATRYYFIKIC